MDRCILADFVARGGGGGGPFIGALLGAVFLVLQRRLRHILVPIFVTTGTLFALLIGLGLSSLGSSTEVQVLSASVTALIVVLVGSIVLIWRSILVLESHAKELGRRTRTIERFLEGAAVPGEAQWHDDGEIREPAAIFEPEARRSRVPLEVRWVVAGVLIALLILLILT